MRRLREQFVYLSTKYNVLSRVFSSALTLAHRSSEITEHSMQLMEVIKENDSLTRYCYVL